MPPVTVMPSKGEALASSELPQAVRARRAVRAAAITDRRRRLGRADRERTDTVRDLRSGRWTKDPP
ncbi:hypothetical protein GCM10027080_33070 [Pedococcus soli]